MNIKQWQLIKDALAILKQKHKEVLEHERNFHLEHRTDIFERVANMLEEVLKDESIR